MSSRLCRDLARWVSPPSHGTERGAPRPSPSNMCMCLSQRDVQRIAPPDRCRAPTRTGGVASDGRRGTRARARREPHPGPAGTEARQTPSGSDDLLWGEIPAGEAGVRGTGRPRPRAAIPRQQLGRAMDRDWAGRTGRTGRSNAGTRLADFFISGLLSASNRHCNSHRNSSEASVADRPPESRQFARLEGFSRKLRVSTK
jgi:hypothetical protein